MIKLLEYMPILACEECKQLIINGTEKSFFINNLDIHLCENCYDNYFYCESCENIHNNDDAIHINDSYYCESCARQNFTRCNDCNSWLDNDDSYYSESQDSYYCESCYYDNHSNDDDDKEFPNKRVNFDNNTYDKIKYNRCYGIELEISYDDIDYYEIQNNTCFGSKNDCSINAGSEIYSPILQGDIGYNEIKKLCNITENYDNDNSAGMHLHIDARDIKDNFISLKKLWYMYNRIECMIYKIIESHRESNTYCKKSKIESDKIYNLDSINELWNLHNSNEGNDGSRYFGCNIEALQSHSTIELRYMHGISNFKNIINWIKLHLYIFRYCLNNDIDKIKRITTNINGIDRYITFIGIISKGDYDLINFWIGEYNKYNKKVYA